MWVFTEMVTYSYTLNTDKHIDMIKNLILEKLQKWKVTIHTTAARKIT